MKWDDDLINNLNKMKVIKVKVAGDGEHGRGH